MFDSSIDPEEFVSRVALPIYTIAGPQGVFTDEFEGETSILVFTTAELANLYFDEFRDSMGDLRVIAFPDPQKLHLFLKFAAANSFSQVVWDVPPSGEVTRVSRIENMLEDMG